MRKRLEREQGARNPLKAGRAAITISISSLMYLRLRERAVSIKVLNTPERIEVIVRRWGISIAEDAAFLSDAATLLPRDRSRPARGDRARRRPAAHEPRHRSRSSPIWYTAGCQPGLRQGTIESVIRRIRRETRAFFERVFGGE